MKKVFLLLIISLFTGSIFAQKPFEGRINYSVNFEGEGTEGMEAFFMSGYEFHFSDKGTRLKMIGGFSFMMGDFVNNYKTGKSYMIMDDESIAYEIEEEDNEQISEEDKAKVTIVKTNEKEKILGYQCTKYVVTTIEDSTTVVMDYWTTTELNIVQGKTDLGASLIVNGLEGFPMKIVYNMDGLIMTQQVTEVIKETVNPTLFEVPKGYEIKPFSESPLNEF